MASRYMMDVLAMQGEFTDNGCETHFNIDKHPAFIKSVSSGHKVKGLIYSLVLLGIELKPVKDPSI